MPISPPRRVPPPKSDQPSGPWWHHRRPKTPEEHRQYAALQFVMQPHLERALLIRTLLPDVAKSWRTDLQLAVEAYAKKRAAKVELGAWRPPEPDPALVDELHAAAATLAAGRPPRVDLVDAEQRAAFRAAVAGADWRAVVAAFRAWQVALDAAEAAWQPWVDAHGALMLAGATSVPHALRPIFTDELDAAVNSGKRMPYQPGPGQ